MCCKIGKEYSERIPRAWSSELLVRRLIERDESQLLLNETDKE